MRRVFRRLSLALLAALSLSFPACELINPDEEVPSFLFIDSFSFTTVYASHGLASFDLPDAHVYVDNRFIGIYELPATVPIMASGKVKVSILPGTRENLQSIAHRNVRVLRSFDSSITLVPGELQRISPRTSYRDNVRFAWMEDFEDNSNSLVFTSRSARDTVYIMEGNAEWNFPIGVNSTRTLHFNLGASDSFKLMEVKSFNTFTTLPNGGRDTYLELDYRSNVPIQAGMFKFVNALYEQVPLVVLPSTNGRWRKAYLNYAAELATLPANTPIEIYFGIIKQSGFLDAPRASLDNLKLSYLE
ncbi:MAG: hypothetical protein ACK5U7_12725 [Bacteroidota bacterium]